MRYRYRKPEITDPEFAKQLMLETDRLIATTEKESAKRRALERKKNPEIKVEEEDEAEKLRKEKQRVKAAEADAKNDLLDRLIKEEDAKRLTSMDLPPSVFAPVTPQKKASAPLSDTPARNTRSKSRAAQTPQPESRPIEEVESDKSAARRRTKKA